MKQRTLAWLLATFISGACTPPSSRTSEDPNGPVVWQPGDWQVVWQDEFEGAADAAPDPTRWTHEIGGWGWGNKELQYYTDSTNNAALDGAGNLAVTARAEEFMGSAYTSARLTTKGLFAQAFGRFEARLRLVSGRGLWPAFWIMGDDIDQVGWPNAGEVDIMEQRGSSTTTVWGSVHGPAWGMTDSYQTHAQLVPEGVDQAFHVYAVEWDPASLVFLVDEQPYFQITPARRPLGTKWVFDHPFFVILNLAVGGFFGGIPDPTVSFPQTMLVDYIRVSVRRTDVGATDGGPAD